MAKGNISFGFSYFFHLVLFTNIDQTLVNSLHRLLIVK